MLDLQVDTASTNNTPPSTKNLIHTLSQHARNKHADTAFTRVAEGQPDITITHGQLDRRARTIAGQLQRMGLAGQNIALSYPPGLGFIEAYFGVLYAGCVAVPTNQPRRRTVEAFNALLLDANVKYVLSTGAAIAQYSALPGINPDTVFLSTDVISFAANGAAYGTANQAACGAPSDALDNYKQDNDLASWKAPDLTDDSLAMIQYTSGSTTLPKGVMITHGNLAKCTQNICESFHVTPANCAVTWLPPYHDMGLVGGILAAVCAGKPSTIMAPSMFLQNPLSWLSAISSTQANVSGGPNFAYDLCTQKITDEQKKSLDLSSWSLAFVGAETVRAETLRRFAEAFAECGFNPKAFYPCYGLAEATLMVSGPKAGTGANVWSFSTCGLNVGHVQPVEDNDPSGTAIVGCGGAVGGLKIAIVDSKTRRPADPLKVGEVWVSGESVGKGYWNDPIKSGESFGLSFAALTDNTPGNTADKNPDAGANNNPPGTADLYLRTGDLGFMHEGHLCIVGRIDDVIIIRGLNYHPQDIELTARLSHELLAHGMGAAFGYDDEGQQKICVVHEADRKELPPALKTRAGRKNESNSDQPTAGIDIRKTIRTNVLEVHGVFIDTVILIRTGSLARTSSGKVQRKVIRKMFLEGKLKPTHLSAPATPGAEISTWIGTTVKSKDKAAMQLKSGDVDASTHNDFPAPQASPATDQETFAPAKSDTLAMVCQQALAVSRAAYNDVTPDTHIAALGMDSLKRVELLAALDKSFGHHLPDTIYTNAMTLSDLASAVEKHMAEHPVPDPQSHQIPEANYKVEQFQEYLDLKRHERMLLAIAGTNPYFQIDQGQKRPGVAASSLVHIDGKTLTNFCNYDYVGMSHNPAVVNAAKAAIDRYGTGAGASRLVSGQKQVHSELEQEISSFLGTQAALVFVSGHATNVTTIGHLMGPDDLIVHDIFAHNSILQGAALSGSTTRGFTHNDWQSLDRMLASVRHKYRRVLIVIEGLYSMDGDYPDLTRFVEVKKKHHAMLYVDEAHSFGTIGKTGRGIAELCEVKPTDVDIWMGTLSKSLAASGGYIAGSSELIEYLKYTAPGFVYSVGLSPPGAATALASLKLLAREPQRVDQLRHLSAHFVTLAQKARLNTGLVSAGSPIIPIIIGNSIKALLLSRTLYARGINVLPILHPAVPEEASRLRFFITINHTEKDITNAVDALTEESARL